MAAMASAALVGCTGMVGSYILTVLQSSSSISSVSIIARRTPSNIASAGSSSKIAQHISSDTTTWPPYLAALSPPPSIYFTSLATTRAAAGGFEKQYALEHDLNIELARAAKESGSKVCVVISSAGANPTSFISYSKMKGEIEKNIEAMNFEHTVIVRPGLIAGKREESRPTEAVMRKLADLAGKVSTHWLKDGWAQEAEVIAKAAVSAGLKASTGDVPKGSEKVWILNGGDIVRLGRTDWKE